ncbi:MAG TPA: hypothetical protein VN260_07020, partial [Dissulfurispiraceae bacterium]|nr:hypothetical protein [Dissulfurispiraceae bacterium]
PGGGQGNRFRGSLSPVFGESVVKETVDRHTFETAVTVNWNRSWFSSVQYIFTSWQGDSGTASSHGGYLSAGYRF